MAETGNYQLKQWESEDRILMEDFNADNAKVDQALKSQAEALAAETATREAAVTALANKSRFTKLKEINITSATTNIEISFSDVDWTKWDKVHLDCITTNSSQMIGYFNSVASGNNKLTFSGAYSVSGRYHPRITFYPGQQANRSITFSYLTSTTVWNYPYTNLQKLIITGDTMNAGAKFVLWGEA